MPHPTPLPADIGTSLAPGKRRKEGFGAMNPMLGFLLGRNDVTQIGVALVVPCIPALIVTFTPADRQGRGGRRGQKLGGGQAGWEAEGEGRGKLFQWTHFRRAGPEVVARQCQPGAAGWECGSDRDHGREEQAADQGEPAGEWEVAQPTGVLSSQRLARPHAPPADVCSEAAGRSVFACWVWPLCFACVPPGGVGYLWADWGVVSEKMFHARAGPTWAPLFPPHRFFIRKWFSLSFNWKVTWPGYRRWNWEQESWVGSS